MAKKKKRTKSKKQSGSQTKARREQKAKKAAIVDVVEVVEVSDGNTTVVEVTETVAVVEVPEEQTTEEVVKEKTTAKKEKKAKKTKKEASAAAALLKEGVAEFKAGHYRDARKVLVKMLDSNPSPEEKEQALEVLGNMEMDVRTLMVGAVAMITLLLIPTLGYENFAKALWTLPVLFLLLIVDPRLFSSPSTASEEN